MNDLILEKYSKLPLDLQAEVREYIESLFSKYQEKSNKTDSDELESGYGSAKGMVVMSDDFDEPLEEFEKCYYA